MPFYEFYCVFCNRIFTFYSRRVNTSKIPSCPLCNRKLKKMVSSFYTTKTQSEDNNAVLSDIDESKLMQALHTLERDVERIDEEDPRQVAQLMRKFTDMTGINLGKGWNEALERLEAGEDPEKLEQELETLFQQDHPLQHKRPPLRKGPPVRDEKIYEL